MPESYPQPVNAPQNITDAPATHSNQNDVSIVWREPTTDYDRVFEDAVKLRQRANELIHESRALSRQSRELTEWWRAQRKNRARTRLPIATAKVDQPSNPKLVQPTIATRQPAAVATAKRVPWRRLQMDDVDGSVVEWTAPEYTQVFS